MKSPLVITAVRRELADNYCPNYIVWIDDHDDEWVATEIVWDHVNKRMIVKA